MRALRAYSPRPALSSESAGRMWALNSRRESRVHKSCLRRDLGRCVTASRTGRIRSNKTAFSSSVMRWFQSRSSRLFKETEPFRPQVHEARHAAGAAATTIAAAATRPTAAAAAATTDPEADHDHEHVAAGVADHREAAATATTLANELPRGRVRTRLGDRERSAAAGLPGTTVDDRSSAARSGRPATEHNIGKWPGRFAESPDYFLVDALIILLHSLMR